MPGVLGLDMSLVNTGMCFIPDNWGNDFSSLDVTSIKTVKETPSYGSKKLESRYGIERYIFIAKKIIEFIGEKSVSEVYVENYSFSTVLGKNGKSVQSASVSKLAELGGVVKSQVLLSCHLVPIPIVSSSARKIVLGKINRDGGQKIQVRNRLSNFGFNFDNDDCMDAFVIAYAGYCEINGFNSVFC